MRTLYSAVVLSVSLASFNTIGATLSEPRQPIESRFQQSDCVFAGVIVSAKPNSEVRNNGSASRMAEVLVHIERDYKGDLAGERALLIEFAGPTPPSSNLVGESDVFFVKQEPPGQLLLAKFPGAMLPFSPPATRGHSSQGPDGLQSDMRDRLVGATSDQERERQLDLLSQFGSIDAATEVVLNRLVSNDSPEKIRSLTILARSAATSKPYARRLISAIAANPETASPHTEEIFNVVASSNDPENLKDLETIASTSTVPPLRQGAMDAIRGMESPETIPFLAEMLDSQDRIVQYDAIITLAEMTKTYGNYAPSLPAFKKDPARYVQMWREWANKRGIH